MPTNNNAAAAVAAAVAAPPTATTTPTTTSASHGGAGAAGGVPTVKASSSSSQLLSFPTLLPAVPSSVSTTAKPPPPLLQQRFPPVPVPTTTSVVAPVPPVLRPSTAGPSYATTTTTTTTATGSVPGGAASARKPQAPPSSSLLLFNYGGSSSSGGSPASSGAAHRPPPPAPPSAQPPSAKHHHPGAAGGGSQSSSRPQQPPAATTTTYYSPALSLDYYTSTSAVTATTPKAGVDRPPTAPHATTTTTTTDVDATRTTDNRFETTAVATSGATGASAYSTKDVVPMPVSFAAAMGSAIRTQQQQQQQHHPKPPPPLVPPPATTNPSRPTTMMTPTHTMTTSTATTATTAPRSIGAYVGGAVAASTGRSPQQAYSSVAHFNTTNTNTINTAGGDDAGGSAEVEQPHHKGRSHNGEGEGDLLLLSPLLSRSGQGSGAAAVVARYHQQHQHGSHRNAAGHGDAALCASQQVGMGVYGAAAQQTRRLFDRAVAHYEETITAAAASHSSSHSAHNNSSNISSIRRPPSSNIGGIGGSNSVALVTPPNGSVVSAHLRMLRLQKELLFLEPLEAERRARLVEQAEYERDLLMHVLLLDFQNYVIGPAVMRLVGAERADRAEACALERRAWGRMQEVFRAAHHRAVSACAARSAACMVAVKSQQQTQLPEQQQQQQQQGPAISLPLPLPVSQGSPHGVAVTAPAAVPIVVSRTVSTMAAGGPAYQRYAAAAAATAKSTSAASVAPTNTTTTTPATAKATAVDENTATTTTTTSAILSPTTMTSTTTTTAGPSTMLPASPSRYRRVFSPTVQAETQSLLAMMQEAKEGLLQEVGVEGEEEGEEWERGLDENQPQSIAGASTGTTRRTPHPPLPSRSAASSRKATPTVTVTATTTTTTTGASLRRVSEPICMSPAYVAEALVPALGEMALPTQLVGPLDLYEHRVRQAVEEEQSRRFTAAIEEQWAVELAGLEAMRHRQQHLQRLSEWRAQRDERAWLDVTRIDHAAARAALENDEHRRRQAIVDTTAHASSGDNHTAHADTGDEDGCYVSLLRVLQAAELAHRHAVERADMGRREQSNRHLIDVVRFEHDTRLQQWLPMHEALLRKYLTTDCFTAEWQQPLEARAAVVEGLLQRDQAVRGAILTIQRAVRRVRKGFLGWRKTHQRIRGEIRLHRARLQGQRLRAEQSALRGRLEEAHQLTITTQQAEFGEERLTFLAAEMSSRRAVEADEAWARERMRLARSTTAVITFIVPKLRALQQHDEPAGRSAIEDGIFYHGRVPPTAATSATTTLRLLSTAAHPGATSKHVALTTTTINGGEAGEGTLVLRGEDDTAADAESLWGGTVRRFNAVMAVLRSKQRLEDRRVPEAVAAMTLEEAHERSRLRILLLKGVAAIHKAADERADLHDDQRRLLLEQQHAARVALLRDEDACFRTTITERDVLEQLFIIATAVSAPRNVYRPARDAFVEVCAAGLADGHAAFGQALLQEYTAGIAWSIADSIQRGIEPHLRTGRIEVEQRAAWAALVQEAVWAHKDVANTIARKDAAARRLQRFVREVRSGGIVGRSGMRAFLAVQMQPKRERLALYRRMDAQRDDVEGAKVELFLAIRDHNERTASEFVPLFERLAAVEERCRARLSDESLFMLTLIDRNHRALLEELRAALYRAISEQERYWRCRIEQECQTEHSEKLCRRHAILIPDVRVRAIQRAWRCYRARAEYRRRLTLFNEQTQAREGLERQRLEIEAFVRGAYNLHHRMLSRQLFKVEYLQTLAPSWVEHECFTILYSQGILVEETAARLAIEWRRHKAVRYYMIEREEETARAQLYQFGWRNLLAVTELEEAERLGRRHIAAAHGRMLLGAVEALAARAYADTITHDYCQSYGLQLMTHQGEALQRRAILSEERLAWSQTLLWRMVTTTSRENIILPESHARKRLFLEAHEERRRLEILSSFRGASLMSGGSVPAGWAALAHLFAPTAASTATIAGGVDGSGDAAARMAHWLGAGAGVGAASPPHHHHNPLMDDDMPSFNTTLTTRHLLATHSPAAATGTTIGGGAHLSPSGAPASKGAVATVYNLFYLDMCIAQEHEQRVLIAAAAARQLGSMITLPCQEHYGRWRTIQDWATTCAVPHRPASYDVGDAVGFFVFRGSVYLHACEKMEQEQRRMTLLQEDIVAFWVAMHHQKSEVFAAHRAAVAAAGLKEREARAAEHRAIARILADRHDEADGGGGNDREHRRQHNGSVTATVPAVLGAEDEDDALTPSQSTTSTMYNNNNDNSDQSGEVRRRTSSTSQQQHQQRVSSGGSGSAAARRGSSVSSTTTNNNIAPALWQRTVTVPMDQPSPRQTAAEEEVMHDGLDATVGGSPSDV